MRLRTFCVTLAVLLLAVSALAVVGGGDITLEGGSAGKVVFSHEKHVAAGQSCQACHAKLFTNAKQHKKATMADMGKGKSCGACHDGKTAFSVKENCKSCHGN